jgi:acetyltransferase
MDFALANMFGAQSIAVVGASDTPGKIGNILARNLTEYDYTGKVFFVNPNRKSVLGEETYSSLTDISEPLDVAVIAVPAEFILDIISEASDTVKNYVIISAGFSESGQEGQEREQKLDVIAKEKGLRIVGPNCLGYINPYKSLNLSFASGMPQKGHIALASQSGALTVAFMDKATQEHLGFSSIISTGNKMQVDEAMLLRYFANDSMTDVIALYIEGVVNGQEFLHSARYATGRKPVVVLKSGRTETAQKAISSHTGALAGSDDVFMTALEQAGVLRADTMEEFFNMIRLLSQPRHIDMIDSFDTSDGKKPKLAIVTNAGGPGVLTTDSIVQNSLELAQLSQVAQSALQEVLPEEAAVANPVDLLGDANTHRYLSVLEVLETETSVDAILVLLTPQDQTPVEEVADVLIHHSKTRKTPLLVSFIGGAKVHGAIERMRRNGVSVFSYPHEAVEAYSKIFSRPRRANEYTAPYDEDRQDIATVAIESVVRNGRTVMPFLDAKKLLKLYGIESVRARVVSSSEAAPEDLTYPCAIKVDAEDVLHKTDQGGVVLNIQNEKQLFEQVWKLEKKFSNAEIIWQPMTEIGQEIIVGLVRDPLFGPVVLVGMGGIFTEVFDVKKMFLPPVSADFVREELLSSRLSFLFESTRGQAPYPVDQVVQVVLCVGALALEASDVQELDINPLVIYNDGRDPVALDIKVLLSSG